jgi:phage virion morphogenesis protein
MINITVDDKGVVQLLKRIEQKMGNMRPVMRVIAGIMHDAVEENFEKEGRPKWKPLKKSTIKQRERKGHWPGKILQVSGQLASSITQKATSTSAIVGTNKKYAAIHQFGGKAGRGHKATIPARPFLKLDDKALDEIRNKLIEYVKE